jgi:hypothetical protein
MWAPEEADAPSALRQRVVPQRSSPLAHADARADDRGEADEGSGGGQWRERFSVDVPRQRGLRGGSLGASSHGAAPPPVPRPTRMALGCASA